MKTPTINHSIIKGIATITFPFLLNACIPTSDPVVEPEPTAETSSTNDNQNNNQLPTTNALSYPTNVMTTAGDGEVTISWDTVAGADSYNIYIDDSTYVSPYSNINITNSTTSPITITGLQNDIGHSVVITAVNAQGESSGSVSVRFTPLPTQPDPVADFSAIAGNQQITVSWGAAANATRYTIHYAQDPDFTVAASFLTTSSTSYTFSNLANGTTYYYRIMATNGSAESTYSSPISAIPDLTQGWNARDEIGRHAENSINDDFYGRTDSMNSNRDVLSSWDFGPNVYANTYSNASHWGTTVQISSSGYQPSSSLAENGDGIIVWAERIGSSLSWTDEIYAQHYQSGIWGSHIPLSGAESGSYSYDPDVKLDSNGNALAVWRSNGHFYARSYEKASDAWSAVTQVSTISVGGSAIKPLVEVDNSGVFVVAWSEEAATASSGNHSIFIRKFSNAGGWQATEMVSTNDPALGDGNGLQDISVNGSGDIFILWSHYISNSDMQLLLRRFSSTSSTWASSLVVDTSNFAIDGGATIKSDIDANAIIYWKKRVNDIEIIESNNFAIYSAITETVGPIEEMLVTDYNLYGHDTVASGNYNFSIFYGLTGINEPTHAYQRVYDFNSQTWSAPTIIHEYFGNRNHIATANALGEILLTAEGYSINYSTLDSWEIVRASFYIP